VGIARPTAARLGIRALRSPAGTATTGGVSSRLGLRAKGAFQGSELAVSDIPCPERCESCRLVQTLGHSFAGPATRVRDRDAMDESGQVTDDSAAGSPASDAICPARRGWDVTVLEVSSVALERAAGHARGAGLAVRWVHAGLAEAALPPASFDLVSAQYPALLPTPGAAAERALLAAVAPDGVLLVVHHAGMDSHQVHDSGFDRPTTSGPRWSLRCSTATGRSSWTSSGRASHPMAGPARITPTTLCCAPADCAEILPAQPARQLVATTFR
jgi:hypothetical protein